MSTINTTTTEEIIDFAEVEWKFAEPSLIRLTQDYSALPSVQALMDGKPLEIPSNTSLHKLYRYVSKHGYILRKRTVKDVLIIWLEKRSPTVEEPI
jgi:hypothetical protein